MPENLLLLLFIICFAIFTSIVLAKTDRQDVLALNELYKSLNSPSKLNGWTSSGGNPCDDSWDGITCKGSSVAEIKLSDLGLSGSLGYQLANLNSVTHFDLSKNNLNGNLPYQLPPSLVYLDLSENDFNGNVAYSISLMNDLNYLNLGHNQLNGELSDMFQKLPKLETIDLSFNQLSGQLPQSFANLTSLKTLYLQDNQLKGSINVLRDLPQLNDLNVANNQFSGWIPDELKEIGNIETGGNHWSSRAAPPPPPGTHKRDGYSGDNGVNEAIIIGVLIAAAGFGGLILASGALAVVSRNRTPLSSHFIDEEKAGSQHSRPPFTPQLSRKLHYDPIDSYKGQKTVDSVASVDIKAAIQRTSSTDSSYLPATASVPSAKQMSGTRSLEQFALADLQDATTGFAPVRVLGEGSIGRVYRAKYPDGRILAVKEIDSLLLNRGKPEEFSSLVSNIWSICHPNMAELIGYCSEQGRNLLVYEYFRSGSLHSFLHLSENFSKPLTWNTRIRIALGTARAIEYLHETCSPPLVHKNIKSSNILLDSELNPHLSDYGLANFHHRTSQNLGVGYNAPECINPSAYTLKSDVYSFGVVMLELLTGRMPSDSSRAKSEESLVSWASPWFRDLEALEQIVDPALCGLYPPESVSRFSEIVSLCVQAEPEFRPPVSQVVEQLVKLVERSNIHLIEISR